MTSRAGLLLFFSSLVSVAGCSPAMKTPTDPGVYSTRANSQPPPTAPTPLAMSPTPPPEPPPYQTGEASWYGAALAGKKTTSGERFDPKAFTAAHNTLKLGTWVEVRRLDTGRAVRVRINDRGPHAHGRIIDVSRRAAEELGFLRDGVARVEIRVVDGP